MIFYYEALKKHFMEVLSLSETNFISQEDYNNEQKRNDCKFPMILIRKPDQYVRILDQSNIDLKNEIKINVNINIEVITNDIEDIINIENAFKSSFTTPQSFLSCDGERCVNDATIELNDEKTISHMNIGENQYKSVIHFKIYNIILEKEIINPIKIELDTNIQKSIIHHLCLIEMTWDKILLEMENLINSDDLKVYKSDEEKIENMNSEAKERYDYYSKQLTELEEQATSMYNFQNLCTINMSMKNYDFWNCYKLMVEKNINITQACDVLKKDLANKSKKEKYAEEVYTNKGDEVLNKYTDMIVEDFKKNIKADYPISIYGGSTYMRYYYDDAMGKMQFPIILINESTNYSFEIDNYTTENISGEIVPHKFSTKIFPINYGIYVFIMAKSQEQMKEIEDKILDEYKNGKNLKTPDPIYENEFCKVKLKINNNVKIEHKNFGEGAKTVYRSYISFEKHPNVYYFKSYKSEDMENDLRLQLRQLQQAEFCLMAKRRIQNYILLNLDSLKKLLTPKKNNSILGNLGTMLSDSVFRSAEYKQLKSCIENHQPIERNLFETVYKNAVKFYPDLYDKIIGGCDVERIITEVESYKKEMENRYIMICGKLGIPYTIEGFSQGSGREREALIFYINKMTEKSTCTLTEAISEYKNKLVQEQIEREKARAEREAERAYYGEEDNGSSGGGLLSGVLKTATGVALGNKMSGVGRKRGNSSNGKKDLMGSSGCVYGKKDKHGFTQSCPSCPLKRYCTRG